MVITSLSCELLWFLHRTSMMLKMCSLSAEVSNGATYIFVQLCHLQGHANGNIAPHLPSHPQSLSFLLQQ